MRHIELRHAVDGEPVVEVLAAPGRPVRLHVALLELGKIGDNAALLRPNHAPKVAASDC